MMGSNVEALSPLAATKLSLACRSSSRSYRRSSPFSQLSFAAEYDMLFRMEKKAGKRTVFIIFIDQ